MRKKDPEKVVEIYNSVIDVVGTEGIGNISIKKIAQQADISPGTLYTYFKDKNELLNATYIEIHKRIANAIFPAIPEGDSRHRFLCFWELLYKELLKSRTSFSFIQQMVYSTTITESTRRTIDIHFKLLLELFNEAQKDGHISKNKRLKTLTAFTYGGFSFMIQNTLTEEDNYLSTDIQALIMSIWFQ